MISETLSTQVKLHENSSNPTNSFNVSEPFSGYSLRKNIEELPTPPVDLSNLVILHSLNLIRRISDTVEFWDKEGVDPLLKLGEYIDIACEVKQNPAYWSEQGSNKKTPNPLSLMLDTAFAIYTEKAKGDEVVALYFEEQEQRSKRVVKSQYEVTENNTIRFNTSKDLYLEKIEDRQNEAALQIQQQEMEKGKKYYLPTTSQQ